MLEPKPEPSVRPAFVMRIRLAFVNDFANNERQIVRSLKMWASSSHLRPFGVYGGRAVGSFDFSILWASSSVGPAPRSGA